MDIVEIVSKWGAWVLIVAFMFVGWALNEDKRKEMLELQNYYDNIEATSEELHFHYSLSKLLIDKKFANKSINLLLVVCALILMGILMTLLNQAND
jgi:hypothetical protein